MTLPVTDSALIGACLAASALGLLVLTSSGGGAEQEALPAATEQAAPATQADDALAALGAVAVDAAVELDDEFGAKVRAYLLQNPEVIFEAVAVFEQRNVAAQANMDVALVEANAEALFADGYSWVGGNPDGDITLVEFIDYRCGFCKRAFDEVETLLHQDGSIRLITKEFPVLGPESEMASRFAITVLQQAGDDAYAQTKEALFRQNDAITPDFLEAIAEDLGLDFGAVADQMGSDDINEILMANRVLAQNLNITGTPTFVMETELIRGFVEVDIMTEIADSLRNQR